MDDISTMRYAHSDGHTDVCYDDDGKYLVTCGTDGDIRIWNGFEDDDPTSHHIGDSVTAVTFKKHMIYLSSDTHSVVGYTFPKVEFEGIIAQFSASVNYIVCSRDGVLVAAGGEDFVVKIYDTSKKSLIAFRGHDGPILSIALDPNGKYMASSSFDGTVRIWQMSEQTCKKNLNILKKYNGSRRSEILCNMDWSPDGQFLAVPLEKEIKFYQKETWTCGLCFTDPCILQNLSTAKFSACGTYLAASTINGQMVVWNVKKNKCVSKKSHENNYAICSLAWNPNGKELAFCDDMGQLGIYEDASHPPSKKVKVISKQSGSGFVDFESMDDDAADDFGGSDDDDLMGDGDDIDNNGDIDDDDDENAFDIGAIKATLEPKIFGEKDDESMSVKSEAVAVPDEKCQIIQAPKAPVQTAFQPSSTPVSLERRFMLWNSVGIVRCYNTEEENSIDVEFHDTNVYHSLHLNNTRNHTMAALSTEALLLACPKIDDSSSKIECLHFGTWDSNKEWIMEIPQNEEIESIALGSGWAVAITDKKFVRILTISGVQTEIFTLPGPVVCSTASNDQLAVAYHKGSGIDSDQCLGLIIGKVKLGQCTLSREYSLPLNSKSFLNWLGYSDEEHPCIVDTAGTVSLLNIASGGKWVPVADTKANLQGRSDSYFITGLSETKQEIRCILCKGSRYPALLPRPTISVLTFSLPFCEMSSDKGRLEEENQKYLLLNNCLKVLLDDGFDLDTEYNLAEKKRMEILLKMFALATRTEREYRALDIAELMPNHKVVQGAIKYATQRHSIALAERLGEVMRRKIDEGYDKLNNGRESPIEEEYPVVESISRRSVGLLSKSKEEGELQPKPLSRLSSSSTSRLKNDDETVPDSEISSASASNLSLMPKTVTQMNPFKANSKSKQESPKAGSMNIDSMLKNTAINLATKTLVSSSTTEKKQHKQSRLFAKKESIKTKTPEPSAAKSQKSGFQLFFQENKDKIEAENSVADEKELTKLAMKLFKELSAAEKKKYLECTAEPMTISESNKNEEKNGLNHSSVAEANGSFGDLSDKDMFEESASKRKMSLETSNECDTPERKKLKPNKGKLSSTTVAKLTKFAFTKTPKS